MRTNQFATIVMLLCIIASHTTEAGKTVQTCWEILASIWLLMLFLDSFQNWRRKRTKNQEMNYDLSNN